MLGNTIRTDYLGNTKYDIGVEDGAAYYYGLIGNYTGELVKDLYVNDLTLSASVSTKRSNQAIVAYIGGLIGWQSNAALIQNVHITGNSSITINAQDSGNSSAVKYVEGVGGLVGLEGQNIIFSSSSADITYYTDNESAQQNKYIAGIVGCDGDNLFAVVNNGDIAIDNTEDSYIAGIASGCGVNRPYASYYNLVNNGNLPNNAESFINIVSTYSTDNYKLYNARDSIKDITQKYSNEELQTFASLPESKKLIQILQNDGGKALNAAIQHLQSGSVEKAMELHKKYYCFFRDQFIETNPIPIKAAMAMAGLIEESYRLPLCELSAEHREQPKKSLVRCGILK
jgi:hypothetical protein